MVLRPTLATVLPTLETVGRTNAFSGMNSAGTAFRSTGARHNLLRSASVEILSERTSRFYLFLWFHSEFTLNLYRRAGLSS